MTTTMSDSEKNVFTGAVPVMFCQTTEEGGSSKQLVRGAAPSTPRHGRKEKRQLSELMFFRCTPEDRAIIETNAASAGLEKSSYLRVQSIGKPKIRACRRVRADWNELRRCMGVINKAGNVVNQLVVMFRRVGGHSDMADQALAELRRAAREVVAALGGH
ncbi:MAG: hypothetical protein P4L50_01775 [Anaerolineaceae bacterium]|nr:hypothetical protein [Alphaproteobacteria bacterium]MDR3572566.1 hypothetical protein [Anaerolineaceae bacterium]